MMRLPQSSRAPQLVASDRRGATLTEVLMSLLIMSIGVISVFSLYPIAVLRSIQSTQLTHSKILLGNAEAEILGDPAMLNGAPPWRPNTVYRSGDVISPPGNSGQSNSTAPIYFVCTNLPAPGVGRSGNTAPDFVNTNPNNINYTNNGAALNPGTGLPGGVVDGTVVWQRATNDATGLAPHAPTRGVEYPANSSRHVRVIDPYGWATHNLLSGPTTLRDSYGRAPRFAGGLPGLTVPGRSTAYLGAGTLSVEAMFRGRVGYRSTTTPGFFTWNGDPGVATANDEALSAQSLRSYARSIVRLPDSYESSFPSIEGLTVTTSPGLTTVQDRLTQVTFPSSPESLALLQELETTVQALEAASEPQLVRAVFESADNGAVVTRWLVSAFDRNDNTTDERGAGGADVDGVMERDGIDWTGDADTLDHGADAIYVDAIDPSDFGLPIGTPLTMKSVRFEVNEPRFTWLTTIALNQFGEVSDADCVVFFRRSFDVAIEQGYESAIGDDPLVAGGPAAVDLNRAWIRQVEGGAPAEIAVGRWLFDSTAGHWYQISAILDTDQGASGDVTIVELDRSVETPVNNDGFDTDTTRNVADPQVVIPRGVVRVYPLNLTR